MDLKEILHELIDATHGAFSPNRRGELHQAVDDLGAAAVDVDQAAEDAASAEQAPGAPQQLASS